MFKKVIYCFCLLMMVGCRTTKEIEPFTITMFYFDHCGYCQMAKDKFIPALEETFGKALTMEYISLDTIEGEEKFEELIGYYDVNGTYVEGKLANVSEEYIEMSAPLFVVSDRYAFFGYNHKYQKTYLTDIKQALNHEDPLSSQLSEGRFYFK